MIFQVMQYCILKIYYMNNIIITITEINLRTSFLPMHHYNNEIYHVESQVTMTFIDMCLIQIDFSLKIILQFTLLLLIIKTKYLSSKIFYNFEKKTHFFNINRNMTTSDFALFLFKNIVYQKIQLNLYFNSQTIQSILKETSRKINNVFSQIFCCQ